ncbi:SAM-dependent methyltransferase [Paenibacillus sp. PL91]|uniref:SAM-dependent methyltransferase n=1 Tax=Paenibacillus sp. PL91 TaxID=2729538 RepID=UPI00145C67E5|nr:SAM-dependent methyltransferase [Paenibacillus sp. PL91]MBC9202980.1 SAM-dependent methyltransferase [Paenibacillus sp. PL91]
MNNSDQPIYRFSEAPIWELQRAYFEEQGIEAWQNEEVPQYITNNPVIATAYAEILFGFLQDRARLGHLAEPVTILELGAGSGRLAFQVLKELGELIDYAGIALPPYRYVMSDLPVKNMAYWQQHPSLKPFVQQGILDFAKFDAVHDAELHLTQSGDTIKKASLKQPLLIIANYFFDSIPQELIYVDEGNIFECRVSLTLPDEGEAPAALDMLERMVPEYHYRRAAEYEQKSYPYLDVIELYKQKLEDSHILFPETGLDCLERLGQLSQEGFALLTADKGDHRLDNWAFAEPPKLIHHGSFSLTANYHAIQQAFERKGAWSHFTEHHYKNLNVGCILMLQSPTSYANTRLAYRRFVDRFGPDDFFSMKLWFDEHLDQLGLAQMLAFWRLGRYDAQLFLQSAKRMLLLVPDTGEEEMEDLRQGIHLMWAGYYPMNEKHDLALDCAVLLYQLELYEDARVFFERSLSENEGTAETLYSMAICCYELERETEELAYAQRVLTLDPQHEGARALLRF